jgi:hypothetical protein
MAEYSKTAHKLKFLSLRLKQRICLSNRPEVRLKDIFGRTLQMVVRKYQPKTILELGAWDGQGATSCLLSKMNYLPERMTCVELNPNRADVVRKQIVPLFPFVDVYEGSSITYEQFSFKKFQEDLWEPLPDDVKKILNFELVSDYWKRESESLKQMKTSYFAENPDTFHDMVVIDGGECTGYDEYRLLDGKYNIIALDDAFYAFKSCMAYRELLNNPEFELLACSYFVRRGCAVFARKEIVK